MRTVTVILVCLGCSSTLAGQTIQTDRVYRPGDILAVSGGPFDADFRKNCVAFPGLAQCTPSDSVSMDLKNITLQIPVGARSGIATVQSAGRLVGRTQIQIKANSSLQDGVKTLFSRADSSFVAYLLALAALGTLSMSIIQALKNLLPMREVFQSHRTRWWLARHLRQAAERFLEDPQKHPLSALTLDDVENELVLIAADGNRRAFYNSEGEDFLRQLTAVGRLVLNYPTNQGQYISYGALLAVMASNIAARDLQILAAESGPAQDKLDARNRVQLQITQAINAFQLSSSWWWQNGLHIAAFLCSTGLAYLACWLASGGVDSHLSVLVTSALASFLAPVARDLVSAITNLSS